MCRVIEHEYRQQAAEDLKGDLKGYNDLEADFLSEYRLEDETPPGPAGSHCIFITHQAFSPRDR